MRRIRSAVATLAWGVLAVAGCQGDGAMTEEPGEDAGAEWRVPQEGEHASATFHTTDGPVELTFVVQDGHAIYQGDIDLGPVERIYNPPRGGAVEATLGRRWPNGIVPWSYAPGGFSSGALVLQATALIQQKMPFITFVPGTTTGNFIQFQDAPANAQYGGLSQGTGMLGGAQYIKVNNGGASTGTVVHEILHALGFWHEQSRQDRDSYIDVLYDCVDDNWTDQYDPKPTSLDLGPYDYASLMHYTSGTFCAVSPIPPNACLCPTMVRDIDGSTSFGNSTLSNEDVNVLFRMYGETVVNGLPEDAFGGAVAIGDFDGDGYGDVAVGATGGSSSGVLDAGQVVIFKGTSARLVPWQSLVEEDVPGASSGVADHFGSSLAVGDFDGDGLTDLAVGAPDKDVGGQDAAGAVFLFRATATGLVGWEQITQTSRSLGAEEAGDHFGSSLAAGQITASVRSDLAIGAPNDRTWINLFTSVRAGAVYLIHKETGAESVFKATRLTQSPTGVLQTGDRFGDAIAIADLDLDGKADVVVGAPETESAGTGAVYVYKGLSPSGSGTSYGPMAAGVIELRPSAANGDAVGQALALGNFNGAGAREIAVGAPLRLSQSGRVYVYSITGTFTTGATFSLSQTLSQTGPGINEAGDHFGAALAAGNFLGTSSSADDLAVGTPGENGSGDVFIFTGTGSGLSITQRFDQADFMGGDENAGDGYGASLAVGNIDLIGNGQPGALPGAPSLQHADIIVGAPWEEPDVSGPPLYSEGEVDAGAIYTILGGTSSLTTGLGYDEDLLVNE